MAKNNFVAEVPFNEKFDSWWLKELNFPCAKDLENYDVTRQIYCLLH